MVIKLTAQNEKESEKSLRKAPENKKQVHHLVSALTATINLMDNEIIGHETNIQMHKDQINMLTNLINNRKNNLIQYNERKQYLLDYKFPEEPVVGEEVIVESVEPIKPKKDNKEKISDDELLVLSLLKSKGIKLDTVIDGLQKG